MREAVAPIAMLDAERRFARCPTFKTRKGGAAGGPSRSDCHGSPTSSVIKSPAWRVLSLSSALVLDRIEIEHLHNNSRRERAAVAHLRSV